MLKHATATAYIISLIDNTYKLLLHKHKKLGIWIGIGGHVEEYENPYETVLREVKEETGLSIEILTITQHSIQTLYVVELPLPYTILEEKIPAFGKEREHYHIDHIYIGTTITPGKISMYEEFKWFTKDELTVFEIPEEVKKIGRGIFRMLEMNSM